MSDMSTDWLASTVDGCPAALAAQIFAVIDDVALRVLPMPKKNDTDGQVAGLAAVAVVVKNSAFALSK